ncbi:response regulator [bacterium]|nr:response regulator [bacterium]
MHTFEISKSKILIVDDIEVNLLILTKILQKDGYNIITTNNGQDAIKLVVEENPDLILLDIMMPGLDGFTTCRTIKTFPQAKDIPIIFISGKRDTDDIVEGFQAGGVDYIQKPFYPKELLARVATHLTLRNAVIQIEESEKKWKKIANERDLFSNIFIQSKHGILITDLDNEISFVNNTFLDFFGYSREFLLGKKSNIIESDKNNKDIYEKQKSDLSNSNIAFWTGEVLIKKANNDEIVTLLTIDTLKNEDGEPIGYSRNYIDIQEVNALKLIEYELEKQKIYEQKLSQIIVGLCAASEYSDETTGRHVLRVNEYSKFIAEKMGLDDKFVQTIGMVAALHDIGKVAIQSLIKYPGKYTPEQRLEMQNHTIYGADIISKFADETEYEFKMAKEIALHHHQSFDGDGYPAMSINGDFRPLVGEEIPIAALIVSIADMYDALRSKRSYKNAMTHEQVVEILAVDDRTGKKGIDRFGSFLWNFFLEYNKDFDRIYNEHRDDN